VVTIQLQKQIFATPTVVHDMPPAQVLGQAQWKGPAQIGSANFSAQDLPVSKLCRQTPSDGFNFG
jgi:hypothetical protein